MGHDHCFGFAQLSFRQASVRGQRYIRREPELCLSVRMLHMDVDSRFFPGKEEHAELPIACNCWSHPPTLPDYAFSVTPSRWPTHGCAGFSVLPHLQRHRGRFLWPRPPVPSRCHQGQGQNPGTALDCFGSRCKWLGLTCDRFKKPPDSKKVEHVRGAANSHAKQCEPPTSGGFNWGEHWRATETGKPVR